VLSGEGFSEANSPSDRRSRVTPAAKRHKKDSTKLMQIKDLGDKCDTANYDEGPVAVDVMCQEWMLIVRAHQRREIRRRRGVPSIG